MCKKNGLETYKLSVTATVLMVFTTVYGFVNICRAYYLMGYAAIFWYILAALIFLFPYILMVAEYGTAFCQEKGGIFFWMTKSIGPRYAFVAMFMVYVSNIVWMVATSSYIWIPFSTLLSGYDATQSWVVGSLTYSQVIGILAILWIIFLTFVASQGIQFVSRIASVGGIALLFLNACLIVGSLFILYLNKFQFAQPIEGFSSFYLSPNNDYTGVLPVLAFFVFAIYAYGGTETTGGLVDKMDNPGKNFPKALFVAVLLLAVGYTLGIFLLGTFLNWQEVLADQERVNLGNLIYVIMDQLGFKMGQALNLSVNVSVILGVFLARMTALCMFASYVGAFFMVSYSSLKQLMEGSPKGLWPEAMVKTNKKNMLGCALWVQASIVVILIFVITFLGKTPATFFERLVSFANVAMTLPYAFLAFAYMSFKFNDKISKPFVVIPNKALGILASLTAGFAVLFANVFTIIMPVLTKGDWGSSLWMLGGPVIFISTALLIYHSYTKRLSAQNPVNGVNN